jgi:tetratricopeptide (TPR) repeat protein
MKLAALYDQRLGNAPKAIENYKKALEVDADNVAALEALEKLYSRDQNWGDLLGVYRSKVSLTASPAATSGSALPHRLPAGRDARAEGRGDRDLQRDPRRRVREPAGDRRPRPPVPRPAASWALLAENLERQLTLSHDPQAQVDLNLRLGELRLTKLEQAAQAVETYHRALAIDPTNATALAALETLLTNESQQLTVAKTLEPFYRASNNWPRLIQAYEIMVTHSQDPEEKIGLLHRIAELQESGKDDQAKAFEALGRAFKVDPANPTTQERLEGLARQMGAYQQLVAPLRRVDPRHRRRPADHPPAREDRPDLRDDPRRRDQGRRLVRPHPRHRPRQLRGRRRPDPGPHQPEQLRGARQRGRPQVGDGDSTSTTARACSSTRPRSARCRCRTSPARSRCTSRSSRSTTPTSGALDALDKLYVTTEAWEPLRDIYRRKTELAAEPEHRAHWLHLLGQVYDQKLTDVEHAIETYQAILDIQPADYHAIQALDRLFGQAERWSDQLSILERAVDVGPAREEKTELRHRIGALWENQLADMVRAVEAYRETLAHAPDHAPTIAALDRIVHGTNEPMLAAEVLAPLYDQLAEWEKLVDIYEVMVKNTQDPVGQIERLHMIAAIYERQLSQYDNAFAPTRGPWRSTRPSRRPSTSCTGWPRSPASGRSSPGCSRSRPRTSSTRRPRSA